MFQTTASGNLVIRVLHCRYGNLGGIQVFGHRYLHRVTQHIVGVVTGEGSEQFAIGLAQLPRCFVLL